MGTFSDELRSRNHEARGACRAEAVVNETIYSLAAGVLVVLIREGFAYRKRLHDRRERTGMQAALSGFSRVFDALNRMRSQSRFERVILIRAHNGGKLPQADRPMFSTVHAESYGERLGPAMKHWQSQLLDEEYVQMLFRLSQRKFVHIVVEEMAPCELRDLYAAHGVKWARVVYVHGNDGELWYLSLNAVDDFQASVEELNLIRETCNTIAEIVRKP